MSENNAEMLLFNEEVETQVEELRAEFDLQKSIRPVTQNLSLKIVRITFPRFLNSNNSVTRSPRS